MPRVLLYEYLTALGIGKEQDSPDHGIYLEGLAMRDAIAEDLRAVPGIEVALASTSAQAEHADFLAQVQAADSVFLIAPEFEGILKERARWVQQAGVPTWGATPCAIGVTADKWELAKRWESLQVPTPQTWLAEDWTSGRYPVVLKDREGAGSSLVALCRDPQEFEANRTNALARGYKRLVVQKYVPGQSASVAFLMGPGQIVPLRACSQRLSDDGRFHYLGGDAPLSVSLSDRALALGLRAVQVVPGLAGYVGVDLILGEAQDGLDDFAIEINPRLTTSYVGLRSLCVDNLAAVMQKVLVGEIISPLRWRSGRVRFESNGNVVSH